MNSLIVFDGDDTLWLAEPLYDEARRRAAQLVAASTGLDEQSFEALQRTIDLDNVRDLGTSRVRFPRSSVQAYRDLVAQHRLPFDDALAEEVWAAAATVFSQQAPLIPGVSHVLESLADRYPLALLTQGDAGVQQKRVRESGLAHFFNEVCIVKRKTDQSFNNLLGSLSAEAEASWSIGNSLASDINPALRVGMSAIWIDRYVWQHERRESVPSAGRVICANSLMEIHSIVESAVIPM